MRPLLGTFVEAGASGPGAAAAVEAAFRAVADAQARWSFHAADSELSRLNRHPQQRVPVCRATLGLLRISKLLMKRSDGAFDCTVGATLVAHGALPDHGGPDPLPRGNADDIELGDAWAILQRPVRLTLDGIAKGFAVDLGVRAMRRLGAASGWINAGGDLRAFGGASIPVQRREADGSFTPLGRLWQAAIATSRVGSFGDVDSVGTAADTSQERFPACIVPPAARSSAPGLWTVMAHYAWLADALTKVAANTPERTRRALIERLGGCLVQPELAQAQAA